MNYDEELKKKIEEMREYAKKMNYSEEELAKLIESDITLLFRHLAMKFPDKLSQVMVLGMLIEYAIRFKFEVDLALLLDEVYRQEENERN